MAQSPTHKFGQIVGDLLQESVKPVLAAVAKREGVYLDFAHERPARNGRKTVRWVDAMGNSHDLDYVMEEGGSETQIGKPRAFIETAWRRYTKHSRNKAQEIKGAVLALARAYQDCHPFIGAILGGVFTGGSLEELKSNGFEVIYFPYETVLEAFAVVSIDADFGESTPDREVQRKVDAYERLTEDQQAAIRKQLRQLERQQLHAFVQELRGVLGRTIERVYVTTLHGRTKELTSPQAAITFLQDYQEAETALPFVKYEIGVRYTNGDEVTATFQRKTMAVRFLQDIR